VVDMPPKRRLVAAATKSHRAAARGRLGPLSSLIVSLKTRNQRYRPACVRFFSWLADQSISLAPTVMGIDAQVAGYIEYLWQEGDGRNMAGDILSGLTFFCPHVKGSLHCSWQLFKTWSRQELPARAPPIPEMWVLAMSCLALRRGWRDMAVVIPVAFYGLLRTLEAASLLVQHCTAAARGGKWVLELGLTKGAQRRGALESVVVAHPIACALLAAAVKDQKPGTFLLQRSMAEFRRNFQSLLWELGLSHLKLQPYSLRRGGATRLFRESGSFDEVAETGRWGHTTTAKVYINEGLATLSQLNLPQNHSDIIHRLASEFCRRCRVSTPDNLM